jgi:hypothetical protein
MSSPVLPFNRDKPGSWQIWEGFWLDFLNAQPLLPWPGRKAIYKRVIRAEKIGTPGGPQDGVDVRAIMEDHTILVVQCKDRPGLQPKEGKAAMDLAEEKYRGADAYFLAVTSKNVSLGIQKEADRREKWMVVGLETLSSWFFSGALLAPEKQKRLAFDHWPSEAKALFPIVGDNLLITPERFFRAFKKEGNLHRHDAKLQGEKTNALAKEIMSDLGANGGSRVVILTATGGQGKSRFLKAVAESVEEGFPQRIVRFQNDAADAEAEDYGLRAADFDNACIFIDDAHRLENLRSKLLCELAEHPGATVMIAARPNSLEPLKRKLLDARFTEADWKHVTLPSLENQDIRRLALEILGNDQQDLATWLAEQSKDCILVCTVGAELLKSGKIDKSLIGSPDFQRRVFDHLRDSVLDDICEGDPILRKKADRCLRVLAVASPIDRTQETAAKLAKILELRAWDVDELLANLKTAGLLRFFRKKIRVVPDLLADHLVYETAYGNGKLTSLVNEVIETFGGDAFANLFGNLAEAEWRARQDATSHSYLDGMWKMIPERLQNLDDHWIHGLMNAWGKFAFFQPERTLELATRILELERARLADGRSAIIHDGTRYDPLASLLTKLPDLIAPIAFHHRPQRQEALDLLWEVGLYKGGDFQTAKTLPVSWQKIVDAASFRYWDSDAPLGVFEWLKGWMNKSQGKALLGKSGQAFLTQVASSWFYTQRRQSWSEDDFVLKQVQPKPSITIDSFRTEVLDWLEQKIIPHSLEGCWAALGILFCVEGGPQAGLGSTSVSIGEGAPRTQRIERLLRIFQDVLNRYNSPVIRLSIWKQLSGRAAKEITEELKTKLLSQRASISCDTPFQLARLASSFHINEWRFDQLLPWRVERGYEASSKWWVELANQTVAELRRSSPALLESLDIIDQVDRDLNALGERQSWDQVADSWAKEFPDEKSAIVSELLLHPNRALLPCLGYFITPNNEAEQSFFEDSMIQALNHTNSKVQRAALHRLSWRDVKHSDSIERHLEARASSDDPDTVAVITDFLVWNQFEATPYLERTLAALNCEVLSPRNICRLGETISYLIEYGNHPIQADNLKSYFTRLENIDDLSQALPDQVMGVIHREYPEHIFRVYLSRIRKNKPLSWELDGWSLPELAGHTDYETFAREIFDEAIRADNVASYAARKLFDAAVARVRPHLASSWLLQEMDKIPLKRIIKLTGCGNGSLVYEEPGFTRKLLEQIKVQPSSDAKDLFESLVFCAVPHSWGSSGGELNDKYLWARDGAAKLAEEYRADPLLHGFYKSIVKNQEELVAHERRRLDNDFDYE